MLSLNSCIGEYTRQLQSGELQRAHREILLFLGDLRKGLSAKRPGDAFSRIYPGVMDLSFFTFAPLELESLGLKIVVAYLHPQGAFEVWLSARNRSIAETYGATFRARVASRMAITHDEENLDALLEHRVTETPDFEAPELLKTLLEETVDKFTWAVEESLREK